VKCRTAIKHTHLSVVGGITRRCTGTNGLSRPCDDSFLFFLSSLPPAWGPTKLWQNGDAGGAFCALGYSGGAYCGKFGWPIRLPWTALQEFIVPTISGVRHANYPMMRTPCRNRRLSNESPEAFSFTGPKTDRRKRTQSFTIQQAFGVYRFLASMFMATTSRLRLSLQPTPGGPEAFRIKEISLGRRSPGPGWGGGGGGRSKCNEAERFPCVKPDELAENQVFAGTTRGFPTRIAGWGGHGGYFYHAGRRPMTSSFRAPVGP